MGRPPTPSRLKIVRGTAAHNPGRVRAEPQPELAPDNVRPPDWLDLSPLARKAWHDLVPYLRGMGVLTRADRVALALLCDALASYVTAKATVAEHGATYETTNDQGGTMIRKHPAVEIGGEASRFAKVMLSEFGLTPAARSKVSRIGGAAKDPTQEWLEGSG